MKFLKRIREYFKITQSEEIARRYFVMNSFDGVLTVLGIVLGSFVVGGVTSKTIIYISFITCFAMFVSGFFGTFMTEKAERERELKELEKNMLRRLRKSKRGKAVIIVSLISSLIDGISPFIGGIVVVSPFFFSSFIGISLAYKISFLTAFLFLFVLGAYLGKISKSNLFVNGIKMVGVGALIVILMILLKIHV
ncbi:MAG TPA: hypothetical protein ENF38_01180 [Candidatus Aenigmarchaeota archaeon]|nr:hypothetical protein [Candidatus Aenigmarchaeota archaeon]